MTPLYRRHRFPAEIIIRPPGRIAVCQFVIVALDNSVEAL